MSSRQVRTNRRRKMNLSLDLNRDPPIEENVRGEVGPSTQRQQQPQPQAPIVDVDDIDDDVVECSPRSFAEAKSNAARRRVRRRTTDVESEDGTGGDPENQAVIINLENNSDSVSENAKKEPEPPKEPVFNCPICMGPLAEEMSTRCGHIFCKSCIKAAVSSQGKCPTCRKRVAKNSLIRVFLPSTS